ncbi:hypothetical protein HDZ31DRAFT_47663, partial [Schizophyllum fasciatum]
MSRPKVPSNIDKFRTLRRHQIAISFATSYDFNSGNREAPWYGTQSLILHDLTRGCDCLLPLPQMDLNIASSLWKKKAARSKQATAGSAAPSFNREAPSTLQPLPTSVDPPHSAASAKTTSATGAREAGEQDEAAEQPDADDGWETDYTESESCHPRSAPEDAQKGASEATNYSRANSTDWISGATGGGAPEGDGWDAVEGEDNVRMGGDGHTEAAGDTDDSGPQNGGQVFEQRVDGEILACDMRRPPILPLPLRAPVKQVRAYKYMTPNRPLTREHAPNSPSTSHRWGTPNPDDRSTTGSDQTTKDKDALKRFPDFCVLHDISYKMAPPEGDPADPRVQRYQWLYSLSCGRKVCHRCLILIEEDKRAPFRHPHRWRQKLALLLTEASTDAIAYAAAYFYAVPHSPGVILRLTAGPFWTYLFVKSDDAPAFDPKTKAIAATEEDRALWLNLAARFARETPYQLGTRESDDALNKMKRKMYELTRQCEAAH